MPKRRCSAVLLARGALSKATSDAEHPNISSEEPSHLLEQRQLMKSTVAENTLEQGRSSRQEEQVGKNIRGGLLG